MFLLQHAARHGLDGHALARKFALDVPWQQPPAVSLRGLPALPIDAVAELAEHLAATLGDPHLGLTIAASLGRGVFGVFDFAIRNSPTLTEAGRRAVRYQRLLNDAVFYELDGGRDPLVLRQRVPGRSGLLGRHCNEYTLATIRGWVQGSLGEPDTHDEYRFANPSPGDTAELQRCFGPRLGFDRAENALVIERRRAELPIPGADPILLPLLDRYAAAELPGADRAASWQGRVWALLRRRLAGGAPTVEQAAALLGTSVRNLQRQLALEDTAYRNVLDELRHQNALTLIADSAIGLGEVAFLLGYSEERALHRAFRRWTGESPGRHRKRAGSR